MKHDTMVVHFDYNQCPHDENTAVTVGTFDGLHRGHQRVIQILLERAQALGCRSCLVTFHPHPQIVLQSPGKQKIKILTPVDEKISYLQSFRIDRLVIISFTPAFAAWSAEYFVNNLLRSAIGLKEIIIGHDHAFGNARAGTLDTLRSLGNAGNFSITVVPPFIEDGVPISSTLIRGLLMEGNMEQAAKYLGRPYMIQGKVIPGDGRGRTLNYPTANIALENADKLIPRDGVYICEAEVDSQRYKGMLSIGYRPTFPQSIHTIEMHLLNFSGNLYDKIIKTYVLHFLRLQIKFNSIEELIQRMDLDREATITFFSHKYPIEMLS